ncbi:hypothetical protein [Ornithinimicrobium sp. INDO-MA30-4]|uniref:hypothetical protein n=1 Tax=Ornithinimicrobium sp. INDO-MA30-4 TaxID=2908651 RepID=UPI001F219F1F|nr:hypothetical protein [Ornithinimicrobium sp. INDO-MA30-4]UJH70168.1 hypothetical protein L0A91_13400 [Ornithinimicrobium sp. INDO-MA30-4]
MGAVGSTGVGLDYDLPTQTLNLLGPSGQRSIHGDVFDLLADLVTAVHVDAPPGWGERFAGGLVGYFGYELKALADGEDAHEAATPMRNGCLPPTLWFSIRTLGRSSVAN